MIGPLALAVALGAAHIAGPAAVTLSAAPTHVVLPAGGRQVVHVTAAGGVRLHVAASIAGFGLDLRGRPRLARPGDAAPWLSVRPRALTVGRSGAVLIVSSRRPRRTRPGDHSAVVLLTATQPSAHGVVVRMRIGLVVAVRVRGTVVHRIAVLGAQVRHAGRARLVDLTVANRGNVIEVVTAARLRVTLVRHGHEVARLRPARRQLLPGTTGLVGLRYDGRARGAAAARIELLRPGPRWVVVVVPVRL